MSDTVQPTPCPFVARLVAMLLESRSGRSGAGELPIYVRLLDLEAEARRQDACETSCQLIARVRRISGTAIVIPFPRRSASAQGAGRTFR